MTVQSHILLADPSPLYRNGVKIALASAGVEAGFLEVESFAAADAVLRNNRRFDLLVLDARLPKLDRWTKLKRLSERRVMPLLVTLDSADAAFADTLMANGASGVVAKQESLPVLEQALLTLLDGGLWYPSSDGLAHPPRVAADPGQVLSNREQAVLGLVRQGLKNRHIADRLRISENTVKSHVSNLYRKLQVENRTRLVLAGQVADRSRAVRSVA